MRTVVLFVAALMIVPVLFCSCGGGGNVTAGDYSQLIVGKWKYDQKVGFGFTREFKSNGRWDWMSWGSVKLPPMGGTYTIAGNKLSCKVENEGSRVDVFTILELNNYTLKIIRDGKNAKAEEYIKQ